MVKVIFKNLDKSDFVSEIVQEKIAHVLEKFPDMTRNDATVVVEMENSPTHAGKDDFKVKLIMKSPSGKPLVIQKEGPNLYQASAVLADRLFELLHRTLEKRRDIRRGLQRRWHAVLPSAG